MLRYKKAMRCFCVILILVGFIDISRGEKFVAYSLREACSRAKAGDKSSPLRNLGGITRIAGLVYDTASGDVILVGLALPRLPAATLDDLAVALRARCIHNEFPLVSIDPTVETNKTGLQKVRFAGHLSNTPFGRDFLACDILLKRYSLQHLKSVSAVPPYNAFLEEDIRENAAKEGTTVTRIRWLKGDQTSATLKNHRGAAIKGKNLYQARFWFHVNEPYNAACKPGGTRPEIFCIRELKLRLESQDTYENKSRYQHLARKLYSDYWTKHFDEVCRAYPVLKRLKVLYDLVATADVIRIIDSKIEKQSYLKHLLRDYRITHTPTKQFHKIEELIGVVDRADNLRELIRVSGGIELRPQVRLLNYGNLTVLRSIVIDSRPSSDALVWTLPLQGWRMPNTQDLSLWAKSGQSKTLREPAAASLPGCALSCQSVVLDPRAYTGESYGQGFVGFGSVPSPEPLKGIDMRMHISEDSFRSAEGDALDRLRKRILESRPSSEALNWPADKDKE
jgi:hypothetical protein